MRKLMQINENKLIGIIKNMLLEQSAEEIAAQYGRDVNLNMLPTQGVLAAQPAAQQQPAAAVQQPAAVQPAQQSANYCPYGYQKVTQGPYFICSESENIKNLQKSLGIPPDGKFGINTLRAVYKKFGRISVSDDDIKASVKAPNAAVTSGETTNQNTTQTNNINNSGIVVDVKGLGINGINNAFVKRDTNGNETILLTTSLGAAVYSTNCKLLSENKIWAITRKQYIDSSNLDNLVKKLKYNFCAKTATNINVTNLIKGTNSQIPRNEQNQFQGQNFRAVIKPDKSIHIISDKNNVVLYTSCSSLQNNTFYRNYGQTIKGKTIQLQSLAERIKPIFCTVKK